MFAPTVIQHRGQRILRLDFVDLREPELLAALNDANDALRAAPLDSLRVLAHYASPLTPRTAALLKQHALACKPHIRATAVVGSSFWKVIFTDLQVRGRDNLAIFDDEPTALDWLAAQ